MDEKGISDNIRPCDGCDGRGYISSYGQEFAEADLPTGLIESVTNATVTELLISVYDPEMPGVKLAEQIGCSNAWVTRTRQKEFYRNIQEFLVNSRMIPSKTLFQAYLNIVLIMSKISTELLENDLQRL